MFETPAAVPDARESALLPIKPKALRPGDRVALIAPSGACEGDRLQRGVTLLESWGLVVEAVPEVAPLRYFAASDADRALHLNQVLASTDIAAVLAVRGGYGCARLYPSIDLAALAAAPKIIMGYSDVSLLLDRVVVEAGMVAYHGPMVGVDLARFDNRQSDRFQDFLFGRPGWWDGGFKCVGRQGVGSGPLVGGCLSVLVTSLGTPFEIDTAGRVLFLEDVAERPYRVDRMLTHLGQAGKLADLHGLVIGSMLDCDGGEGDQVVREIVMDVVGPGHYPVVFGLDAGHGSGNVVLPLGCQVELDTATSALRLLESALA